MTDLTYIDDYFKGVLAPQEMTGFEQKIAQDPAFAEEVAFYCSTMQVAKELATEERKKRFREIYNGLNAGKQPVSMLKRWWPYVAAAAIITAVVIGWQLYYQPASSLQAKVNNYISSNSNWQVMGVEMSAGGADSMSTAKQLFNDNKLAEALPIFESLSHSPSGQAGDANQAAGIVSLRLGNYDKAITYFTAQEHLALYINPGKFYHALTLLKRNQSGDKEIAKQLLQQVVDEKLAEKETAAKWLRDF